MTLQFAGGLLIGLGIGFLIAWWLYEGRNYAQEHEHDYRSDC
jgi:hypothetical protein